MDRFRSPFLAFRAPTERRRRRPSPCLFGERLDPRINPSGLVAAQVAPAPSPPANIPSDPPTPPIPPDEPPSPPTGPDIPA